MHSNDMTVTSGILDPSNLTDSIYFWNDTDSQSTKEPYCYCRWKNNNYTPYVHPAVGIRTQNVIHGRGLVAMKDIQAGECLFITPPTVYADQREVQSVFFQRSQEDVKKGVDDNSVVVDLEDRAVQVLVDNMWKSIQENDRKTFNSFLVLMGGSSCSWIYPHMMEGKNKIKKKNAQEKEEHEHENDDDYTTIIETLLGQDDEIYWSVDDDEAFKALSKSDLKDIVLKNAFGPDFITYEKIQKQWTNHHHDSMKEYFFSPHMLGIYPLAAMLNHSCIPNVTRTYAHEVMIVHASKNIQAGHEIVWSYIPPTQPYTDRRRVLKKLHGFICKCDKCELESKQLKKDVLPCTLQRSLSEALKWNRSLMEVESLDDSSRRQICMIHDMLEETVFGSASLSNEVKRYLRVDMTNFYFNYFNSVLLEVGTSGSAKLSNKGTHCSVDMMLYEKVLNVASQLHFAFYSNNHGSTEHLSVLHLCYDLASVIHQRKATTAAVAAAAANDNYEDSSSVDSLKKVRFWTDQLKKAHMVRYGLMGGDVECIRKVLVHTKNILRQKDGFLTASYNFL